MMHCHMNVKIQSDKSHGISCTRETESVQHKWQNIQL